jgi:hypothetical protein
MKQLLDGLQIIVTRKDSRMVSIISAIVFVLLLLLVQNGKSTLQIMSLESMPLFKRTWLAISIFFDFTSTFSTGALLLALFGSVLGGINIALAYTYMKVRGNAIIKSGFYSGMGLVLAFLGIGCPACGTAILSLVLGFFGLSATLSLLPYQGLEIGYIGLLLVIFATYSLARKVASPNVC